MQETILRILLLFLAINLILASSCLAFGIILALVPLLSGAVIVLGLCACAVKGCTNMDVEWLVGCLDAIFACLPLVGMVCLAPLAAVVGFGAVQIVAILCAAVLSPFAVTFPVLWYALHALRALHSCPSLPSVLPCEL